MRQRVRNENICSMQGRASQHPRDEAIRAAHHDAAVLAGILENEYQATYRGPERLEYVRVLSEIVSGLDGSLETGPTEDPFRRWIIRGSRTHSRVCASLRRANGLGKALKP